jgi:hypothetical protein
MIRKDESPHVALRGSNSFMSSSSRIETDSMGTMEVPAPTMLRKPQTGRLTAGKLLWRPPHPEAVRTRGWGWQDGIESERHEKAGCRKRGVPEGEVH